MYTATSALVLSGLCLLCLSGCGDSGPVLANATGTVTHNGQPLSGAQVVFTPESGPVALGTTDAQGRYELSTQGRTGALVGMHTVTVTALEETETVALSDEETEGGTEVQRRSRIPESYASRETSELNAFVTTDATANDFTFDLEGESTGQPAGQPRPVRRGPPAG